MFSQHELSQQIINTLGETLSEIEVAQCIAAAEIIEPPSSKQFWQSTNANAGIYIVIAGKVRLLDSADELITTLEAESSFGAITLFGENFNPYTAKASTSLKVCFLPQEILQALMDKYPQIRDRLYRQAELWDLLQLFRHNFQRRSVTGAGMLKALSYFSRHNVDGSLNAELSTDCKLWLLRRGLLEHSDGQKLTPGDLYAPRKQGSWQAKEPTIAYLLSGASTLASIACENRQTSTAVEHLYVL